MVIETIKLGDHLLALSTFPLNVTVQDADWFIEGEVYQVEAIGAVSQYNRVYCRFLNRQGELASFTLEAGYLLDCVSLSNPEEIVRLKQMNRLPKNIQYII